MCEQVDGEREAGLAYGVLKEKDGDKGLKSKIGGGNLILPFSLLLLYCLFFSVA